MPVTLEAAGYRAEIASTGATLRELHHDGRPLVAGFSSDAVRPAMRGAILVPWPNRTEDGSYTFEERAYQLTVDEPETQTAIHGLVAWQAFTVTSSAPARAVLEATLAARPGYPWQLRVTVTFRLDESGLHQTVAVENQSEFTAPVGIGAHPYLVAGSPVDGAVDEWTLKLGANRVLLASDDRMLPGDLVEVADEPALDFRKGKSLSGLVLNHCYTDLVRTEAGVSEATLRGPDGRGAAIRWDGRCEWVQLYTADHVVDGVSRGSLAVEPMTCPPNALRSGTDILVVPAGGVVTAGWTISALRPENGAVEREATNRVTA